MHRQVPALEWQAAARGIDGVDHARDQSIGESVGRSTESRSRLSKEVGLSDGILEKLCSRSSISFPIRGSTSSWLRQHDAPKPGFWYPGKPEKAEPKPLPMVKPYTTPSWEWRVDLGKTDWATRGAEQVTRSLPSKIQGAMGWAKDLGC
jgi:hypothetical protein